VFQGFVSDEKERMLSIAFDLCLKERQLMEMKVIKSEERVTERNNEGVFTIEANITGLPTATGGKRVNRTALRQFQSGKEENCQQATAGEASASTITALATEAAATDGTEEGGGDGGAVPIMSRGGAAG